MESYCARARRLAATLAEIPGVAISPDPPQTNAFQIYLPGERTRLERAALELAQGERVWLFNGFSETPVPPLTMAEVTIGEAADDLEDEEVVRLLGSLLAMAV